MSLSRMVPAMKYGMVPMRNYGRHRLSPVSFPMVPSLFSDKDIKRFFDDDDDFFNFSMIPFKNFEASPRLKLDIEESDSNFEIVADLPGVPKENVDVSLHDNVLTISAEKKAHKEEDKNGFLRQERSFGRVTRSFTLPENVDADKISAETVDGVLHVSLPKKEVVAKVEDAKKIPVTSRDAITA